MRSTFQKRLVALFTMLVVLLTAAAAAAAGRVTIGNTQPDEADGKWKLKMTIDYGSTPHLGHIPMIFSFEHTTQYELALLDKTGDKPQLVRRPLSGQSPINESMDVGFSDPTGKVFNITKFDFVVRRDRGFEAGEYTLKIKRASDGVPVGSPQKITLKGDNPVIDRRAIVFSGEKKKEAKKEGEGDAKKTSLGEGGGDKPDAEKGAEPAAAADPEPTPPPDGAEPEKPPPVAPKQGGCGCDLPGASSPAGWLAAMAFALAAALARARRRLVS